MGYTLKLDLSTYQRDVLIQLLVTDGQRSEREGTTDTPWATAVAEIREMIYGYDEAVSRVRAEAAETAVKLRRTRVVESIGDPGKWVAQYYDRDMELWFDIGDSADTREEAEQKRQDYIGRQQ